VALQSSAGLSAPPTPPVGDAPQNPTLSRWLEWYFTLSFYYCMFITTMRRVVAANYPIRNLTSVFILLIPYAAYGLHAIASKLRFYRTVVYLALLAYMVRPVADLPNPPPSALHPRSNKPQTVAIHGYVVSQRNFSWRSEKNGFHISFITNSVGTQTSAIPVFCSCHFKTNCSGLGSPKPGAAGSC
jgi:hypothetical protein